VRPWCEPSDEAARPHVSESPHRDRRAAESRWASSTHENEAHDTTERSPADGAAGGDPRRGAEPREGREDTDLSRTALLCAALLAFATGCLQAPVRDATPAERLEADLIGLAGSVDPEEAALLAGRALDVTANLRARYQPLTPPHLGNLAFHLGLRERALCCHWVEDLLHALGALELRTFELHWGVAHFGSKLREHSAVVAVPLGTSFEQGLVLDAWRRSGRLYWTRADRDRYAWRPHPADAVRQRVACVSGSR
jgi:hypothetical protein